MACIGAREDTVYLMSFTKLNQVEMGLSCLIGVDR